MTNPVGTGLESALVILLACAFPTQVWRWIGVLVGQGMSEDSEVIIFVRYVAAAIIAAFVAQVLIFPAGALALVPLWLRLGATAVGLTGFFLSRNNLLVGVLSGQIALITGAWWWLG
jgi:branched-subunit amino acid transport protein